MVEFNATATGMTIRGYNDTSALASRAMIFHCQKSGNDYLASSSNVYSAASANYDSTSYTATFTGAGTISPSTNQCKQARDGGDLLVQCNFTTGTTTAPLFSISLPSGLSIDSTRLSVINATGSAGQDLGDWSSQVANGYGNIVAAPTTSTTLVYAGSPTTSTAQLTPSLASALFASTASASVAFRVPISGWTNSNVIVGSFAGIETCNASTSECVDSFSAKISSGGVVSDENSDFINGNCTWSPAGIATCPFVASKFTVTPNCFPVNASGDTASTVISSTSTSQVVIRSAQANTGTLNSWTTNVLCQKTGVDYKPKTAKVASSIGVLTVPGVTTEAIDTFSVSYGTTNATTVCSASPCSYLDQIGTAVTSITRASSGNYTLNLSKTYTKLKCVQSGSGSGNTSGTVQGATLSCASCSTLNFITKRLLDETVNDSYGNLSCMGNY